MNKVKKYFPLPLIVKHIDGEMWELMEPFEYITKKNEVIKVPIGFLSDFASIPRFFYRMIGPPTGRYGPSAIVHDYLYHTKKYTRRKSDAIFLEAMGVLGVPWWKRRTMWLAVRAAGWLPWNKRKPFLPASMRHLLASIILILLLTSCAHYNPDTKTLWGYGKYKDKDVEIESHGLLKDIVNIQGIKTN